MKRKSKIKNIESYQARGVTGGGKLPRSPVGKEGDQLNTQPPRKLSLLEWLDTLEPFDKDFPEIEDLPPEPVDF